MANKPIDWSPGNWPKLLFDLFTSFKLATYVLFLMLLVTLFGTLDQVDNGLHKAKEIYFHSWFINERMGNIPVILPGGMLLMLILFVNMTLGAIVKVRKRWRGAGLLISHTGMLMLLAGGFITNKFATDDYMALYPGMSSSKVESYREWQLEIIPLSEDGKADKAWIYPTEVLNTVRPDEQRVITTEALPFDVVINGFSKNAMPIPTSAPMAASVAGKEVDGFKLSPQKSAKESEQNLPGAYVEFRPDDGSEAIEGILWAGSYYFDPREKPMPFTFKVGDQLYGALLAKKTRALPFEVRLDKFIFERHPGVTTPRNYESRITRIEEGQPDKPVEIKMNEPMRYEGYTFFQESFGPAGSNPGDDMYSQFAVAKNPADQWPLWALCVTGFGLMVHFIIMLVSYSSRARKKRSASAATS